MWKSRQRRDGWIFLKFTRPADVFGAKADMLAAEGLMGVADIECCVYQLNTVWY